MWKSSIAKLEFWHGIKYYIEIVFNGGFSADVKKWAERAVRKKI